MKLFSNTNFSSQFKLLLILLLAAVFIIIADGKFSMFTKIKTYMNTVVNLFYYLSNTPHKILYKITDVLITKEQLILENRLLRQKLLLKNSELLLLAYYKQDNIKLHELLGSPLVKNEQKIMTKVVFTSINSHSNQVIIDKGINHGVYVGQPIINDKGVVGQVISVNQFTSRVLLICDIFHSLPIQILRNGIRLNAVGCGYRKDLKLEHLTNDTDIRIGDVLVTSGLDGRFPIGYPVAIISSIKIDKKNFDIISKARPIANLQYLHYLLLWSPDLYSNSLLLSNKVDQIANERLMNLVIWPCVPDKFIKTN